MLLIHFCNEYIAVLGEWDKDLQLRWELLILKYSLTIGIVC